MGIYSSNKNNHDNDEKEKCIKDTKDHINKVATLLDIIIEELKERGENHDSSKLEEPELSTFIEYTPKLANCTYGSDEYKENLKGMQVALDHHYARVRI